MFCSSRISGRLRLSAKAQTVGYHPTLSMWMLLGNYVSPRMQTNDAVYILEEQSPYWLYAWCLELDSSVGRGAPRVGRRGPSPVTQYARGFRL